MGRAVYESPPPPLRTPVGGGYGARVGEVEGTPVGVPGRPRLGAEYMKARAGGVGTSGLGVRGGGTPGGSGDVQVEEDEVTTEEEEEQESELKVPEHRGSLREALQARLRR